MSPAWVRTSSALAGQLDAAGLAAPADLHLGFDDDRVADPLRLSDRFVHRVGHAARRHRDAEAGKVLLALVLEQIHIHRIIAMRTSTRDRCVYEDDPGSGARTLLLGSCSGSGGCSPRGQSQLRSQARCALLPAPSPGDVLNRRPTARQVDHAGDGYGSGDRLAVGQSRHVARVRTTVPVTGETRPCAQRRHAAAGGGGPASRAVQLVAGGRGGKECAASSRAERDWPRGAQPPDPDQLPNETSALLTGSHRDALSRAASSWLGRRGRACAGGGRCYWRRGRC